MGVLIFAGMGVVGVMIVSIDGGIWDYGSDFFIVWFYYFYNGVWYGFIVVGKFWLDSGCVNKNVWLCVIVLCKGVGNEFFYCYC